MTSVAESDFDIARRLHFELNGLEMPKIDENANTLNVFSDSIIVLSDDDDVVPVPKKAARSRSPIRNVVKEVTFENQQAITVRNEKLRVLQNPGYHCCCFCLIDSAREKIIKRFLHAYNKHIHRPEQQPRMGRC
jgi:hypothetical protein